MRHVHVDEICEVEPQVGDAGLVLLERHALHVLPEPGEVVPVGEEVDEAVERLAILAGKGRPSLGKTEDGGVLKLILRK